MKTPSPSRAIGWELWIRNRWAVTIVGVIVLFAATMGWTARSPAAWNGLAEAIGYALLTLALVITFGCFHFTEGNRKGGFGSFPRRLFHLPVATPRLVAAPMICGVAAILAVYSAGNWLIFRPLGKSLPLLWPSLYLICALTQFQMIVWSLPASRYGKLFCLCVAASLITFGWMFFLPHMIEGTLEEMGYTGSVPAFQQRLLLGLALAGPLAYGISVWQIHRQRHGLAGSRRWIESLQEWVTLSFRPSGTPLRSPSQALFWHEWRQTGLILPAGVLIVLAMTYIPSALSGEMTGRGTIGIFAWTLIAPILLAAIIGRGFGKPDFWHPSLGLAPFHAVRPISPSQWVQAKLQAGLASVLVTWAAVFYASFLWLAHAGAWEAVEQLSQQWRSSFSAADRIIVPVLAVFTAMVLTLRFLVGGLAIGLSGRKLWFYASNGLTAVLAVGAFVLTIWRSDNDRHGLHLYNLWTLITWLPALLSALVVIKVWLAAWAWRNARHRGFVSSRAAGVYFGMWILATSLLVFFAVRLISDTLWLQHLSILAALLIVPLANPALAMLSVSQNRCAA